MPVISSPRLVIRPLTATEAERALSATEADAPTFAEGYPSAFATEVLRLVALYPVTDQADEDTVELGPWLVVRQLDDMVIGTISCARSLGPVEPSSGPDQPSMVTVGYDFARCCWGQGYATEALVAVVKHLLGAPGVAQVCAQAAIDHVASRRVMEKAGMRWQRDEVESHNGREIKLAHYVIGPADLI
jgi:RimJ/RimL family protein N-acetyltransferase